MEQLGQDLRYALRQIRMNGAFSFFVIATLAVGIGANTTIFSAVNTLLLRPLPYPESDELIQLSGAYVDRGDDWSVSLPNAVSWREASRSFDDIGYYQSAGYSLAGDGEPVRVDAIRTSANFFEVLGVQPALGRGFAPEEATPDGDRVAILSHAVWRQRFAGDPQVLGRTMQLSGTSYTIVGVMPEGFSYPGPGTDIYTAVRADESTWQRSNGGLQVVGRLSDGTTQEQAQAEMDDISARMREEFPVENRDFSAALTPLRESLYGGREMSLILITLLTAVGFVLLIACVNVANLLLARATNREREIAIRAAIGANRSRVLRQLLTESLVLAAAGGAAGIALALLGTRALLAAIPDVAQLPDRFVIDGTVLLFTLVVTLLTGLAFGIAPALQAASAELTTLLGGRSGASSRRRAGRRNLLVVLEVALASVLLIAAGLTVRSLVGLLRTDPGFAVDNLLTMRVSLDAQYDSIAKTVRFQEATLEQLRSLPGVTAAGAVDWIPLGGTNNFNNFVLEGRESERGESVGNVIVSPGYLEAMQIRLLRGRLFDDRDVRSAPGAVIINRTMAERYWPNEDAIGKRLLIGGDGGPNPYYRSVIGIVADVRHQGLNQEPRAEMYNTYAQYGYNLGGMTFVLRTEQDPTTLTAPARRAIASVDPRLAVYDIRSMQRLMRESSGVTLARIMAGALGVFGAVALLLAALGLYGVISYNVAQRAYEMGVRAALGADRGMVLRLVLGQGMKLVVIGLVIGLGVAFAATRVIGSVLYNVSPNDPLTFIGMALTLLAVAFVATWVPARRASLINPMMALRSE